MHFNLFFTVLAAGIVQAGLYGFLPISIILTYRISRTIAFIHGGIAAVGALVYWLVALHNELIPKYLIAWGGTTLDPNHYGTRPAWGTFPATLFTVAFCAALGGIYGLIVMSPKIAGIAVLTLTVISLGAMMGLIGLFGLLNVAADVEPPSPFGDGKHQILPLALSDHKQLFLTDHKIFTFLTVLALSGMVAAFLTRTHTGLVIRALADDQEAGVWCGVKLRRVGTGVYAVSGAIAGLAGILIAVTAGAQPADMLVLFLNGLAIAIVGGLRSLPLAFTGAVIYGVVETALGVGFFGNLSNPVQAIWTYGALLTVIVVTARMRKESFYMLERHSL